MSHSQFRRELRAQQSAAGELPVTAHIQGKYQAASDSLELAQFNVVYAGFASSGFGNAGGFFDAASFGCDFQPGRVAAAGHGAGRARESAVPRGWQCHVQWRSGRNVFFSHAGRDAGGRKTSNSPCPQPRALPSKQVHWDSLAASIQLSSHELALRGRHSAARRHQRRLRCQCCSCRMASSPKTLPFTARVNLHNVDVASTAALAGFRLSGFRDGRCITADRAERGRILRCRATFTRRAPRPMARRSRISTPTCRFGAVRPLSTTFISRHEDADISGSAAYTPATRGFPPGPERREFRPVAYSPDSSRPVADRGPRRLYAERLGHAGRSHDQRHRSCHATLRFDHELAGGMDLEATTKDGELRLTGHSDFQQGTLSIEGNVEMRGDYPANITARDRSSRSRCRCGAPISAGN